MRNTAEKKMGPADESRSSSGAHKNQQRHPQGGLSLARHQLISFPVAGPKGGTTTGLFVDKL